MNSPFNFLENSRRRALRDAALLAVLVCTGLREMELVALDVSDLRQRVNGRLGVAVREGKGAKSRFVPYGGLSVVLEYVDAWKRSAGIHSGALFRGLRRAKAGEDEPVRPTRLGVRTVLDVLERYPLYIDGESRVVRPHDLRRTYARLLHDAGMPLTAISAEPRTRELVDDPTLHRQPVD